MSSANINDPSKKKGILTDVTKCIGCERCVEGCVKVNRLPREFLARFTGNDGLSGTRFTAIEKIEGKEPGSIRMIRRQCMHCQDPACASACLVGAFHVNADGAVEYDDTMCIGCRYCMLACPFSIPRYEYNDIAPLIRKCKMNEDCRVDGGQPACVTACPTGATIFGTREELLEVAKDRMKKNPGKYINHIYGEHDFGGTSVMYISDVPLNDVLHLPSKEKLKDLRVARLAEESVPSLVEPWVYVTPVQFFTVSAGLAGIWFFRRKNLMMKKKAEEKAGKGTKTSDKEVGDDK